MLDDEKQWEEAKEYVFAPREKARWKRKNDFLFGKDIETNEAKNEESSTSDNPYQRGNLHHAYKYHSWRPIELHKRINAMKSKSVLRCSRPGRWFDLGPKVRCTIWRRKLWHTERVLKVWNRVGWMISLTALSQGIQRYLHSMTRPMQVVTRVMRASYSLNHDCGRKSCLHAITVYFLQVVLWRVVDSMAHFYLQFKFNLLLPQW